MRYVGLLFACGLFGQSFEQRGFLETNALIFLQAAENDSGHIVGQALLRYEALCRFSPQWQISGGVDARTDTHHQVDRSPKLSWWDREIQRPAFAVRRLSVLFTRGKTTLELGKQFVRWGKADILNPTDRFAPRDFLTVVENDFLAITAARLTYGTQSDTIDLIWSPRLTPSRVPLLNQRWVVLPVDVPLSDLGVRYPGGSQLGARWNHIGRGFESSLSFYDGHNHLPLFDTQVHPAPFQVGLERFYPRMRMYGGDAAVPLRWLTVKGEAAYFTSASPQADEYGLYVIQLERQTGEWVFVGGYAGEVVARRRSALAFAPDRGFASAFLARASYTIDTNRSLAVEAAIRQNGEGTWVRGEYSQAFRQHWRATAAIGVIRGNPRDFLGQYRRNSHALLTIRYSF